MEIWLAILILFVSLGSIGAYIFLMIYYPEWVGITGKVAVDAEKSHQEGSKPEKDKDFLS